MVVSPQYAYQVAIIKDGFSFGAAFAVPRPQHRINVRWLAFILSKTWYIEG
jgi:hypothetical protein